MPASPKYVPASPGLKEAPNSGRVELGEQQRYFQIFVGKYTDCLAAVVYKGTVGSGGVIDGLIAENCTVDKTRGEAAALTITWLGFGGATNLPADTFSLQPSEQNPNMETHPHFATVVSDPVQLAKIRSAGLVASSAESQSSYDDLSDPDEVLLADLLRNGHTNFYDAAFRYQWTIHFFSLPTLSRGGFIDTPGGPLAATISGLSLDCLREADALDYDNGIYKLTRSWLCGAGGKWPSPPYS
jgi:hypothetical protein